MILTMGEDAARLPFKTELFVVPRLQEIAASDLDGAVVVVGVPSEVPPLITVV